MSTFYGISLIMPLSVLRSHYVLQYILASLSQLFSSFLQFVASQVQFIFSVESAVFSSIQFVASQSQLFPLYVKSVVFSSFQFITIQRLFFFQKFPFQIAHLFGQWRESLLIMQSYYGSVISFKRYLVLSKKRRHICCLKSRYIKSSIRKISRHQTMQ